MDRDKIARDLSDMLDRLTKAGMSEVQACLTCGTAMAALMQGSGR
jgi:hypothetical protein